MELQDHHILTGRIYRAKRPRPVAGLVNDRVVKWRDSRLVQYESPAVAMGRRFPSVTIEKFLAWAGRDVTGELPPGEWAEWPPEAVVLAAQDE